MESARPCGFSHLSDSYGLHIPSSVPSWDLQGPTPDTQACSVWVGHSQQAAEPTGMTPCWGLCACHTCSYWLQCVWPFNSHDGLIPHKGAPSAVLIGRCCFSSTLPTAPHPSQMVCCPLFTHPHPPLFLCPSIHPASLHFLGAHSGAQG